MRLTRLRGLGDGTIIDLIGQLYPTSACNAINTCNMLRSRESLRRIPGLLRPLRPPNRPTKPSHILYNDTLQRPSIRVFTQKSQLLLVSSSTIRPQLPFLHPASARTALPPLANVTIRHHLARLISSERRRYWRITIVESVKISAALWVVAGLVFIAIQGYHQEWTERRFPTPHEWSFITRWKMRNASLREFEVPGEARLNVTRSEVGIQYMDILKRLEDPNIDGSGLLDVEEGGLLVAGIGKTGFDVREKSEPSRRGYHEALMGAARTAEYLDGWLLDKERGIAFPPDVVIGPNNPRPRPVPWGTKSAPREEECVPAFERPEIFYMKILTTVGFTTKQKLDAAIAYGDWLDFKGLTDTAESMFDWALDIAAGGLPVAASNVLDAKTGVFKDDAVDVVSENLLRATKALAVHHASAGNVKAALPIFLSLLKNRRQLPPAPAGALELEVGEIDEIPVGFFGRVRNMLSPPNYPPPPPTGDHRPYHTAKEACEEAGIMANIGEILFASSSEDQGLSWTRDAVDAAEAVIVVRGRVAKETEKCRECLEVGLGNWKKMLQNLVDKSEQQRTQKQGSWLKLGGGKDKTDAKKWVNEEIMLQQRIDRSRPYLVGRLGLDPIPSANNSFLFA